MTPFNPDNKSSLTYREALGPAMKITDPADAAQYLRQYIAYLQKWLDKEPRGDKMTAEQIAKVNLGYYAGYYDQSTMHRVNELFCTAHPIFGATYPKPDQAFAAGKAMATKP